MWWKKKKKPEFQIGFMVIRSWKSNFNVKAPNLLKDRIKGGKKTLQFDMIANHNQRKKNKKKNQAFWKNPNQESRKSTSHNSVNFLTKILAKPKLFLGGYLFIGENKCPNAYLALTTVEIGRREKKWRRRIMKEKKIG